jgi:hypothetical protein
VRPPLHSTMDIYSIGLCLGGAGLGAMALGGVTRHGHGPAHGPHHGLHHAGHHGAHHAAAHTHAAHAAHAAQATHAAGAAPHGAVGDGGTPSLWVLTSPRVLFSVLLGFGATGLLARGWLSGTALLALAVVGGIAFERLAVAPLWSFLFRFASEPAQTLESTLFDEARAASGFDANGEGLVAVELDGQVVQVLGTLTPEDRRAGTRVRAGDRLRIEDVDGVRHRCTVSYVGK